MKTYLVIFLLAAGSSLIFTPLVRAICNAWGWLDEIRDERRVHLKPVPRLGGVAVFGALALSLGTLFLRENLLTQNLRASGATLLPLALPALLIFACGVYDDLRGASSRFKFGAQALAGALFYALGGRIEGLALPFFGTIPLPPVIGCLITIFWIMAVTNAFNLLDGLDGLAAGAALFASLVLLTVSYLMGHTVLTVFSFALCGALAGFLRYNFNPASIFLGDSGSLLLGFLLAALAVLGAQKASTAVALTIPLVAFGLPITDTAFALVRRFISGQPLFVGDREHFHHKLLERGWSHRQVVLVLYAVCASFGLASLLFVSQSPMTGVFLLVVGVVAVLGVSHLRYHEVDEVSASVRRNAVERRSRAAHNVCVRRAAHKMRQAENFGDIEIALQEMLAHGQFGGAKLTLYSQATQPKKVTVEASDQFTTKCCNWSWVRSDLEPLTAFAENATWRLTLPLVTDTHNWGTVTFYRPLTEGDILLDLNVLCRTFRRAVIYALGRVAPPREAALPQSKQLFTQWPQQILKDS